MLLLPPLYMLVDEAVGEITGGDLIFFRGGPSSGPTIHKQLLKKKEIKREEFFYQQKDSLREII